MMRMTKCKTAVGLGLALVLVACGGGGGSKSNKDADRPVAAIAATPAEGVTTGTEVTFDASGSSSPKGNALNYTWELTTRPSGSTAVLSGTETVTTTVTPDKAGAYTVRLVASDSATSSAPVTLTLNVAESPLPVARITAANGALPNINVQLDGSASSPPAGGSASGLSYEWTLVTQPEGSTAALDDATLAKPRFLPKLEGLYKVQLVVKYSNGTDAYESAPVEHSIEVLAEALPPTAKTKVTTTAPTRGQAVQLDASESSIADGRALNYFWRFGVAGGRSSPAIGRPAGSKAVIENPTSATPTFVPDAVGTYTVQLMVWSGKRVSITTVSVSVAKPAGVANTKPVAVVNPTYYSYSYEQEPGIGASQRVTLGSTSYDIDADALAAEWTLLSYPAGFDPAASFSSDAWTTSFQPTHPGTYRAQLRVCETATTEKLCSDPVTQDYTIRTGANIGPVATLKNAVGGTTAGVGSSALRASALVGSTVTLDGSASSGGNGDTVSYQWELVYKPEGSSAALADAATAYPKFKADKEGPYLVRLRVTDQESLESRNTPEILVVAKSRNSAPVLRPVLGGRYSYNGQPFLLDGVTASNNFGIYPYAFDPDGDTVDTLITLTDAPKWPEVRQWTLVPPATNRSSGSSNFMLLRDMASGNYVFELIGSDGMDRSEKHVLTLPTSTLAEYPSLLLRAVTNNGQYTLPARTFEEQGREHVVLGGGVHYPTALSTWYVWAGESVSEAVLYELRAPAGQSYTIVDLKAESDDAAVPVSFIGLSEGQVIQGGTPVQFKLGVTRFPDRVRNADSPRARWSFRVKERPEWVFSAEVPLGGNWTEQSR